MNKKNILMLICLFPATVILYIIMHESGHAIVMFFAGSKITEFNILQAHVSYEGGHYSDFMAMWREVNGTLFPLLISFICMLLYNRKQDSGLYHRIYLLICVIPLGSLLAWVAIPLLYIHDGAPAGDDATKFLDIFAWYGSPVIVSLVALAIILVGMILLVKKGIVRSVIGNLTENRFCDQS